MIHVCLWRWGNRYGVEHLVTMRNMLQRHLTLPHEIVVITDDKRSVPEGMKYYPVNNTLRYRGRNFTAAKFNCSRRMWMYSKEAGEIGQRLLQLDLDVVITDSIDSLIDRPDPLVIWKGDSTRKPNRPHGWAYNATILLTNAGARKDVWEVWAEDPKSCIQEADADGWDYKCNSDQAIATYLLRRGPVAEWTTEQHGIYAYRHIAGPDGMKDKGLPAGCRIVSFHGRRGERNPSNKVLQERSPWIRQHWC